MGGVSVAVTAAIPGVVASVGGCGGCIALSSVGTEHLPSCRGILMPAFDFRGMLCVTEVTGKVDEEVQLKMNALIKLAAGSERVPIR